MPYVNVQITKDGATAEQKRAVIKGITDVLVKVLNKNPDATFVVIDEIDTDNWGHKGTSVTELRKAAAAATAKAAKPTKVKAAKAEKAKKRPDAVPEILVHIVEGRSTEAKKALMKDITAAVVKNFNVPAERVVVQIVESKKADKARGGVPFDEM